MRVISGDEIDFCLEDRAVLETLRGAFRSRLISPSPAAFDIDRLHQLSGTLSVQPAWTDFPAQQTVSRGYIGCSLSLDLPETPGLSTSLYILFSGTGGQPIALLDGMRLTSWRTAGLHALATTYLSREDTARLLVIGDTPNLPRLLSAHAAARNIGSILLVGTSRETRRKISGLPALSGVHVGETDDITEAQEGADIICVAGSPATQTLSRLDPPAGCHIDVLNRDVALPEAVLEEARLFTTDLSAPPRPDLEWAADLRELAEGSKAGRRYYGQRTLFLPGADAAIADHALATHVFLRT
ncbi:ornithine cyclodeaminase [Rhodobacterales bacterium]|nr:ornithine cyclodeaminase [Rhodobacterales bacterium]